MKEIRINESDILWKYYKKYHGTCNLPQPKNLCQYFWTAVGGFIKSIFEINIIYQIIFLLVLGTLNAFAIEQSYSSYSSAAYFKDIFYLLHFASSVSFCLIALSALLLIAMKFSVFSEKYMSNKTLEKIFNIVLLICGTLCLGLMVFAASQDEGLRDRIFSVNTLIGLGWCFGVVFVLTLSFIMLDVFSKTDMVKRLFSQISELIKGYKNKYCPIVIPPDSCNKTNI